MSDFKGIVKGGWHPKGKDGGKESWRGDFKGINQVAGWMGKSKGSEAQAAREHVSRPLAALKDPSSFGPPPKNVNYHSGAALPNEIIPHRSGLGAPLTQADTTPANQVAVSEAREEEQPSVPPLPALPYRADRTGYRTDHLPPPPVHRSLQQSSVAPAGARPAVATSEARRPPPLPTRQNTTAPTIADPPPPSYDVVAAKSTASPYLNQSAVSELSRKGVSVPELGIGGSNHNTPEKNPWKEDQGQPQSSDRNHTSEIQARFARMNTPSQETELTASASPQAQSPAQPTMPSWQQSQSAFQTARNLRMNPQNVSVADAQNAAQTAGQAQRSASAFKEKHADSISKAQTKAKAWDQKYKLTSKINKFLDEQSDPAPGQQQQQHSQQQPPQSYVQNTQQTYMPTPPQYQSSVQQAASYSPVSQANPWASASPVSQPIQSPPPSELTASIARKPPPPPAPRKPAKLQAPPPVPVGTKPSFG